MPLALVVSCIKLLFFTDTPSNKLECCCYNRHKLKRDKWSSLFAVNDNVKKSLMPLTSAGLWGLPSSVQPVRGRTNPDSATATTTATTTTTTTSTAAADGKHNGKAPRHLFQTAFAPEAKYPFLNGHGTQGLHDTQHNDILH